MRAYDYIGYPSEKASREIDPLGFLTSAKASGIYLGMPIPNPADQHKELWITRLCAINTGRPSTMQRQPPVRGLQDGDDAAYMLDEEGKTLTRSEGGFILGERANIEERVVFEGTLDALLKEFEQVGFRIVR